MGLTRLYRANHSKPGKMGPNGLNRAGSNGAKMGQEGPNRAKGDLAGPNGAKRGRMRSSKAKRDNSLIL